MLTGAKIIDEVSKGVIKVSPFESSNVGANSIDVRLSRGLWVCVSQVLDVRKPANWEQVVPMADGVMLLSPGKLYLGTTMEWFDSGPYIPGYEGRSTTARYGIQSHMTAGFGDVGFRGHWTLEITVVHPTVVVPGMRIGQVWFAEPVGSTSMFYPGRYSNPPSDAPVPVFPVPNNV